MTVFKPTGSKVYVYDFQFKKVRYYGSTGETEERLARRYEKNEKENLKRKLAQGRFQAAMTFAEAVAGYVDSSVRVGKNVDEEDKHFDRLIDWIGEKTPVSDITNKTVADVVAKRSAMFRFDRPERGKLTPAAVNRSSIDLLKRVLLRARDTLNQPVQGIEWKKLRRKEAGPRTREISYEEEELIETHLRDGYGAAFRFGMLSGLRLKNLVSLTWAQVNIPDRTVSVVQKGSRIHMVRLTAAMVALLEEQRGHDPVHVFTYLSRATRREPKSGKELIRGNRYAITVWGFTSYVRHLRRKTKITDIRVHDIRRTTGGRMLRNTNNLKAAQQLLGHASIATTARHYAHIQSDDMLVLQEAAEAEAMVRRRKKSQGSSKAEVAEAA